MNEDQYFWTPFDNTDAATPTADAFVFRGMNEGVINDNNPRPPSILHRLTLYLYVVFCFRSYNVIMKIEKRNRCAAAYLQHVRTCTCRTVIIQARVAEKGFSLLPAPGAGGGYM